MLKKLLKCEERKKEEVIFSTISSHHFIAERKHMGLEEK
jgi:hypothetical protein